MVGGCVRLPAVRCGCLCVACDCVWILVNCMLPAFRIDGDSCGISECHIVSYRCACGLFVRLFGVVSSGGNRPRLSPRHPPPTQGIEAAPRTYYGTAARDGSGDPSVAVRQVSAGGLMVSEQWAVGSGQWGLGAGGWGGGWGRWAKRGLFSPLERRLLWV